MKTIIFYKDGTSESFEGIQNPYKVCSVSDMRLVVEYDSSDNITNMYDPNDS